MEFNPTLLAVLGAGLLIGVVVGVLLQRRSGRTERSRLDQISAELDETREELETQRDEVTKHFESTSTLFRDLTEQYTRLYAHLAEGARQFCPDDAPALARGFDGPLLGTNGDGKSAEPTEAAPAPPAERSAAA